MKGPFDLPNVLSCKAGTDGLLDLNYFVVERSFLVILHIAVTLQWQLFNRQYSPANISLGFHNERNHYHPILLHNVCSAVNVVAGCVFGSHGSEPCCLVRRLVVPVSFALRA